MGSTTEHEAMNQLQHDQSRLLDRIDELRTIGVGGLVELPQLIVCGNQSSGKSSVLEAISRVRFPAKSNVCTRFATEVILRRNQQSSVKISIEPGPSRVKEEVKKKLRGFNHNEFATSNDLPDLIEKAKKCMGITESNASGFSDDVLKVEISGPDKPELTLVDLPGLYYSTSQDQGLEGIRIVRGLTEKYMKNSRSIILAVISAKTDYHLQEVLNLAETFDPKRERTMGIITQPDILEAESEEEDAYLKFLKNEKIPLQLGWHALRNRSFETRDISDEARDKRESEFFNHGQWANLPRQCVGIDVLRSRLSGILLKHIRRNLPGLIADIQEKISDREQKLLKLGPARSSLQQQRGFLLSISSNFERITTQALNGMYADDFFGGLGDTAGADNLRRIRAVIRQLNEYFAEAMAIRGSRRAILLDGQSNTAVSESANPYMDNWEAEYIDRNALEAEVSARACANRGIELPGNANQLLVGNLFRDQSKPWEELAKTHLLNAWDSVRYFVHLLTQEFTDEYTHSMLVGSVLEPALEEMRQALLDKLDELTAYTKRGHPLPIGRSFLAQIQKARSIRLLESLKSKLVNTQESAADVSVFSMKSIEQAATELELSRDEFAAGEIIDQMQAYYDTAIVTFVDNVATLGIENCLLDPLQRIFTSQVVNNMEDDHVQNLAAEPLYVNEERKRLTGELEKLKTGLRSLNHLAPPAPFNLTTPSLFPTDAVPATEKSSLFPDVVLRNARKGMDHTAPINSPSPSRSHPATRPTSKSLFGAPSTPTNTTALDAPAQNPKFPSVSAPEGTRTSLFGSPRHVSSKSPLVTGSSTSQMTGTGLFGSPAPDTSKNATGSSAFGSPVQSTHGGSGKIQGSHFGASNQLSNLFGNVGTTSQSTLNASASPVSHGASNASGGPTKTAEPFGSFGATSQYTTNASSSLFSRGASNGFGGPQKTPGPFSATSQATANDVGSKAISPSSPVNASFGTGNPPWLASTVPSTKDQNR
ncbi:P-loop containing nucleoside triphosphate hydrolase protein [Aspergillus californicus]